MMVLFRNISMYLDWASVSLQLQLKWPSLLFNYWFISGPFFKKPNYYGNFLLTARELEAQGGKNLPTYYKSKTDRTEQIERRRRGCLKFSFHSLPIFIFQQLFFLEKYTQQIFASTLFFIFLVLRWKCDTKW